MSDLLDSFLDLYREAPKITKFGDTGTEEFRAFVSKKGLPVALVTVRDQLDVIPVYDPFMDFYETARRFWMVPCETPKGRISGFVLRAVDQKLYRTFREPGTPQIFFGFHGFQGFRPGDPIILTEGVKDALYLQQVYPYTLALLGTGLTADGTSFLSLIAKTFVFALDSGFNEQSIAMAQCGRLMKAGYRACILECPFRGEDWGSGFSKSLPLEAVQRHLLATVKPDICTKMREVLGRCS